MYLFNYLIRLHIINSHELVSFLFSFLLDIIIHNKYVLKKGRNINQINYI